MYYDICFTKFAKFSLARILYYTTVYLYATHSQFDWFIQMLFKKASKYFIICQEEDTMVTVMINYH